jgi:YVTN family beta-propeller protein
MRLNGVAVLASLFCIPVFLMVSGCGDTFRPVASPLPGPGGDPQRLSMSATVADNGGNPGTATNVNVSGDSNVGQLTLGRNPVHAGVQVNSRIYVPNRGDNTVSQFNVLLPLTAPVTITLPAGSDPVFAHTTESGNMYVAEPGTDKVGVIVGNVLQAEITVGINPVALAETPDGRKLYVVNNGSNNVSVINTVDRTVSGSPITVGASPVWAVVSSDGALLFVVNQGSSSVSVIDTSTDTNIATIPVGAGPNFAFYDRSLKRVYVTSPGGNTLSVIKADLALPTLPTELARVSVAASPCSGSNPVAVTALPSGSRAYVANQGSDSVCVLSTTNNQFIRSIGVGTSPVSIGSSFDSTKVHVANAGGGTATDPGGTSVIRTVDDTVAVTIPAPKQDANCTDPALPAAPTCLRQTPRFVVITQ